MTWSADIPADDWKEISSTEVVRRAISRIEAKGRGILLLHDIHERTVVALPTILSGGFKIVQVVPASATMAKTETTPDQWQLPLESSAQTARQDHETEPASAASHVGQSRGYAGKTVETPAAVGATIASSRPEDGKRKPLSAQDSRLMRLDVTSRVGARQPNLGC